MKNAVKELKTQERMLLDKLKSDSVTALKNHDAKRVEVVRYLISLVNKREMQLPPGGLNEAEVISVLRKELKNKEESREMFAKAGRQELVDEVDYEIEVVKEYLPKELSEEELEKMVDEAIAESGSNFGMVMRSVMGKVQGRAGGDVISKMVNQKLKG
ncbi:MAG TPA: GatB/YqeY domain-containing protein [Patescibacteria group bacterium]